MKINVGKFHTWMIYLSKLFQQQFLTNNITFKTISLFCHKMFNPLMNKKQIDIS